VIGTDHPVTDAAAKACGALVFGDDMDLPGLAHAKLLLSPVAHARVRSIDTTRAQAMPGVIGVFSHFNAPPDVYSRYRILPGQRQCPMDEPLFAETARFAGDRIAAVVAEDPVTAETATRLIDVEYEELPPVLTSEEALADGAPDVHPGGNLIHEFVHEVGAPQPGADITTVTTLVSTPRVHHAALEPHLCIARQDEGGKLTIWSPTQSVFGARTIVADFFGLRYSQVRVIKIPMGGSFGGKQEFILEPVTAFLARATRRPVKLVLDRDECIAATMVRPATTSRVSIGVDPDGRIVDVDVDFVLDAGAYATSSPDYAEMMAHKIGRLYRAPHLRHHGRVAYTTTPVAGGARAYGAPEILTAMEIGMDRVAETLGMDPVDLRLQSLVQPGDMDPAAPLSLGDARIRECLELGAEAFGWRERRSAPPAGERVLTGVGVACGAHKNGILSDTFTDFSTMTAKMNEDGSVALTASLHEMGAGVLALMQLIVAEELGIAPDDVSVSEADSDVTPYDFGCYGSRITYVCGAAAQRTAALLGRRLVENTAALSGAPEDALEVADGFVRSRDGAVRLSFADVVMRTKLELGEGMTVQHTHTATSNPGSYCAQFAEVQVDCATGLTRVTDFLVVADVGRALNPVLARGQYHGGVHMGIGYALCEEVRLDDLGRPASGGFKNYHLVNAPDMPEVKVLFVEHDGDDGPYSAKSVGEIATVPTAAAVVNAMSHALGVTFTDLPVTPEKVVAALAAEGGEA
jgi:xanthine dehydrogenase molybdenum-binding subunit